MPNERAVDAEIDLNLAGGALFLCARLNVSLPGFDREVAQQLIDAAHFICPNSKAVQGNINVATTLALNRMRPTNCTCFAGQPVT